MVEFGGGAVEFESHEIGIFQHLVEQCADIIEMLGDPLGTGVGLAAKDGVSIEGEVVPEAVFFLPRLFDECGKERAHGVEFAGVDFEIRVEADDVGGLWHGGKV